MQGVCRELRRHIRGESAEGVLCGEGTDHSEYLCCLIRIFLLSVHKEEGLCTHVLFLVGEW